MKQVGLWFENLLALGFWGCFFYINVGSVIWTLPGEICVGGDNPPIHCFFFWSLLWIIGGAVMFYYWFKVWRQKNIAERGLNLLYLLMFAIGWTVLWMCFVALSVLVLGDGCVAFWAE